MPTSTRTRPTATPQTLTDWMKLSETRMYRGMLATRVPDWYGTRDRAISEYGTRQASIIRNSFSQDNGLSGVDPLTREIVSIFRNGVYTVEFRLIANIADDDIPQNICPTCGFPRQVRTVGAAVCPICSLGNRNGVAPHIANRPPAAPERAEVADFLSDWNGSDRSVSEAVPYRNFSAEVNQIAPNVFDSARMPQITAQIIGIDFAEDDDEALINTPLPLPTEQQPVISQSNITVDNIEGIFTVVETNGTYTTIRIRRPAPGSSMYRDGRAILEYLTGADNSTNYTAFAFLTAATLPDEEEPNISVWRNFRASHNNDRGVQLIVRLENAVRCILGDPIACGERYAIRSSRCFRCNRMLTVPTSLHRGLGPECASRIF